MIFNVRFVMMCVGTNDPNPHNSVIVFYPGDKPILIPFDIE